MSVNTYNGWKNRETWLVNIWYGDNWTCREDVDLTQDLLEEMVDKLGNGILQDMLDLDCIDWESLRDHATAMDIPEDVYRNLHNIPETFTRDWYPEVEPY